MGCVNSYEARDPYESCNGEERGSLAQSVRDLADNPQPLYHLRGLGAQSTSNEIPKVLLSDFHLPA